MRKRGRNKERRRIINVAVSAVVVDDDDVVMYCRQNCGLKHPEYAYDGFFLPINTNHGRQLRKSLIYDLKEPTESFY